MVTCVLVLSLYHGLDSHNIINLLVGVFQPPYINLVKLIHLFLNERYRANYSLNLVRLTGFCMSWACFLLFLLKMTWAFCCIDDELGLMFTFVLMMYLACCLHVNGWWAELADYFLYWWWLELADYFCIDDDLSLLFTFVFMMRWACYLLFVLMIR